MSFSGNPLGQGARLDHTSFMNNNQPRQDSPSEDNLSNSPPRRGVVPLSYAYGAPTLKSSTNQTSPKRIPSPTRSSSSSVRNRSARSAANNSPENEENDSNISYASSSARGQEPGVIRYARLKQRNQALGHTPHPAGPGIILSPPNGLNLRDTSVIVATAFHQAAHTAMPADHERDTSTSASSTHRRIAAPPSKSRKPPSNSNKSLKPPDEIMNPTRRSKSPVLDAIGQAISRVATSPTRYFLREGDPGEEDVYQPLRMEEPSHKPPSRQNTKESVVPSNESYDYEAEENYMRGEASASGSGHQGGHQKKKSASMSAAARLSLDNKAYRPPSDEEDDEEDFEEDGVRRKRKGKKKDEGKGMTLPTIAYDKRKKKKSISRKGGTPIGEDLSVSGDEQALPPAELRKSGSRPPSRAGSVSRDSVPPSHPAHFQQSLEEVQELEEDSSFLDQSKDYDDGPPAPAQQSVQSDADMHQMEAQSQERTPTRRRFSLGAYLGKIVHFFLISVLRRIVQAIAMVFFLLWTVLHGIWEVLIGTPLRWIGASTRSARHDLPWASLSKVVLFAVAVSLAGALLRPNSVPGSVLMRWLPSRSSFPAYHAPTLPAASVEDLIMRLTQVENALADLAAKEVQVHHAAQRAQSEAASRVELLHSRVENEAQRAQEAEEQFRTAAARGIAGVRSEFETLQTEWERLRKDNAFGSDIAETLKELQERVSGVEGGVKETMEAARASVKTVGPGWWNSLGGNEGKLTIKSSDGQDVTALIDSLVDSAISRFAKDVTGKPDFALYSAGGRVIPHFTSNTYEIRPTTWAQYIVGAVTGGGYAVGRPPVTALHPDIHVGNCWPFSGSHGRIGVLLARPNVLVSEISIDHAPRDVAYDIRAAPRQMELWGLAEGADNIAKVRAYQHSVRERHAEAVRRAKAEGIPLPPEEEPYPAGLPRSPHYIRLAQFTYDVHAPQHVQTFSVPKDIQDIGADFGTVVLIIKNNWGEDDFTCLYRMRVHGMDKDRRPYLLPEQDSP